MKKSITGLALFLLSVVIYIFGVLSTFDNNSNFFWLYLISVSLSILSLVFSWRSGMDWVRTLSCLANGLFLFVIMVLPICLYLWVEKLRYIF